jgi:hypothetical protein
MILTRLKVISVMVVSRSPAFSVIFDGAEALLEVDDGLQPNVAS